MDNIFVNESLKLRHPYYKVMELKGEELILKINSLSRNEIIDWLFWNDRNGVYRDDDSIREFGNKLKIKEAREIMLRQITENQ